MKRKHFKDLGKSRIWKEDFKNVEDTIDRGINEDENIPDFAKAMNLVIRTSDLMKELAEKHFKKYDLSIAQKDVLGALFFSGENYLTQTKLSTFVYTSKANVSSLLDRMEKKGLILREGNPENKRENKVMITKNGRIIFEKLMKESEKLPLEEMLSNKECLELKKILTKLRDEYKKLLEIEN
ncbi:MAG: MarR family transcriptional regulator [Candidatus Woesearchaeota archaeon]|jgi:DNA-binding MarR family transcriptional regulator|nr:MarR family transcriptional regulator [Candidatus Woesearchaeota archaeon]